MSDDSRSGAGHVAFGLLGPLEVHGWAGPVTLAGLRPRVVLAALLSRPNQVVSIDQLIDALWADNSPATARDQVLTVVSTLRRLLGDATRPADERLLVTRRPGYLLRVGPGQLDVHRFQRLVSEAEGMLAAHEPASAARSLRTALALWRGPALSDVSAPFAAIERQRLEELRLGALEKLADIEFGLGRHQELVPELTRLVAEYPLRERLRGQLMIALHAVGRKAEALATYRAGRQLMIAELGLEPGPELRGIERTVLADRTPPSGPIPAEADVADSPARSALVSPAHLPPDVPDFTGRWAEITSISRRLGGNDDEAVRTAVPVVVVSGQPGVGKSALATRVGHLVRAAFPDGQLHVALRGSQANPESLAEALAQILMALGTPRAALPTDLDERVRLFRSLTAERRVLLVLDDAVDTAQLRYLLPNGPRCAVLATSRRPLADLPGADQVRLDVLSDNEALTLLTATAGAERVAAEPDAAARIIELCGRLPLAVRIAGAKLALRRHWSLGKLALRLADQHRRLDELRIGDLEVRASLALSFRDLDREVDRAARLLALLDAPDFPAWAAGAALGLPVPTAEDLIDQLVERQLLEYVGQDGPPRYRFHDLIRLCLRERADAWDGATERRAAVAGALRGWLGHGLVALRRLPDKQFPGLEPAVPVDPQPDTTAREAAATDPVGWYEAECAALLAGVRQARELGLDELCGGLVHVLGPFLEMRGSRDVWAAVTGAAEQAAARGSEPRARALAALYRSRADDYVAVHRAVGHAHRALTLFEELGDDLGTAHALNMVTYLHGYLGDLVRARRAAERAAVVAERVGSSWCAARAQHHLGNIAREHGRVIEAERHLADAIRLYGNCGGPSDQADAMMALGLTYLTGNQSEQAIRLLTTALSIYRGLSDPVGQVLAQTRLAEAYQAGGQVTPARATAEDALAIATSTGYAFGTGAALTALARVHHQAGRLTEAADCLTRAVDAWRDKGDRWVGSAQLALGDVRHEQGDRPAALAAWREAARLLRTVAHPGAGEADARLATHDG